MGAEARSWCRVSLLALGACVTQGLPQTQVVVVVDTDLPPTLATRLRVDLFSADGVWFETREVARASRNEWPATFGIVAAATPRDVIARLRVFPDGYVRDYRGERFAELDGEAPADGLALQLENALTPSLEPNPDVTIDRIVRVSFANDEKRWVRVMLVGECAGTMANVVVHEDKLDTEHTTSCFDRRGERGAIGVAPVANEEERSSSRLGTWVDAPCAPAEAAADRLCQPGGVFVFGNAREPLGSEFMPRERIAAVARFFVDRREVTVADYRSAVAHGFVPPEPVRIAVGPLVADPLDGCVYTEAPADRESLPLTCVSWATADAYCAHRGGALPTEAQWEYAATIAGRTSKTSFPWGDEAPTCERASYGRAFVPPAPGACEDRGVGPQPAGAPAGDRTATGVQGMGGGAAEWMRDVFAPLDAACWNGASLADPFCAAAGDGARRSVRGGAWSAPPPVLRSALRRAAKPDARSASIGFRCVYGAP